MGEQDYKICKSCGAKNPINETFCVECFGRDFELPQENKKSEYKICKSCGAKNSIENEICDVCLDRNFEEVNANKVENNDNANQEYKTVIEKENPIVKVELNNQIFQIYPNDIAGREAKLSEILQNISTVSRQHIKFIFENNSWQVQDLNSTNGSYLNNTRLNPSQKYDIKQNDELKLSSKATIKILEIVK